MVRTAIRFATACACAATIAAQAARAGEDVPGWGPGPVEVVNVRFAGAIEIERDGKRAVLWLSGIDAVAAQDGELTTEAATRAREWIAEGPVELIVPRRRSKAGLEGVLRLADGSFLNARLAGAGYAVYAPGSLGESFTREIRVAQAAAKRKELGIWSMPRVDMEEAPKGRNQFATLCGAVNGVRLTEPDGDHVHLGGQYPRHFLTIVIDPELRALVNPMLRTEHEACATGRLHPSDVAPVMAIHDASQMRERRQPAQ